MLDEICGLAIWMILILLSLMILGFFVSFGGTLHIDFVPYVNIVLGSGA